MHIDILGIETINMLCFLTFTNKCQYTISSKNLISITGIFGGFIYNKMQLPMCFKSLCLLVSRRNTILQTSLPMRPARFLLGVVVGEFSFNFSG